MYSINLRDEDTVIRTNVILDEKLLKAGLKITGLKTRKALIDYALRELLRHNDQLKLLKLRGAVNWQDDLNQLREGKNI